MTTTSESQDDIDPLGEDWLRTVQLPRLIAIAGDQVDKGWSRLLDSTGLTAPALGLLLALTKQDGLSHREAARRSGVSPATITAAGDVLERRAYAERRRTDSDRRVVRLWITAEGRRAGSELRAVLDEQVRPLEELLTPAEERTVRDYLIAVIAMTRNDERGAR